jgi:predicted nucleic acid-binding protein
MEAPMILVDTSAWIHHLRRADTRLVGYLGQQRVHTCESVLGELLLGTGLPMRFSRDLRALPRVPSPSPGETRAYVERHARAFSGSGIGWADSEILLAAAKAGARIYSADHAVRRVCRALVVALA